MGSIPGSGRSPGGGHGNSLLYSWLENPWAEEPGGLQRVGQECSNWTDTEWLPHCIFRADLLGHVPWVPVNSRGKWVLHRLDSCPRSHLRSIRARIKIQVPVTPKPLLLTRIVRSAYFPFWIRSLTGESRLHAYFPPSLIQCNHHLWTIIKELRGMKII